MLHLDFSTGAEGSKGESLKGLHESTLRQVTPCILQDLQ